ncbi:MAG: 2-oxo-4-hydroxy-4-carboxy-5-ureidoimidazoline decarboxylase [Candidatus Methylacidiphilales bacterium]
MPLTLDELNQETEAGWERVLGGVFEHAPWVARAAAAGRPFSGIGAILDAMVAAVEHQGEQAVLEILRAHPDLGARVEERAALTQASAEEQEKAGLFFMTETERVRLHALNQRYRERFGFPFIICARLNSVGTILAALQRRLNREPEEERLEAWAEVKKIARLRLQDLIREM